MSHAFRITYTVEAATRLDAISKAVRMLRTDVRFNNLVRAVELRPGWWDVELYVAEDS